MKTLKIIFISIFLLGSTSAMAECWSIYNVVIADFYAPPAEKVDAITGRGHKDLMFNQIIKMADLLQESIDGRVGPETIELKNLLEGKMSLEEIQKEVLKRNKFGGLCRRNANLRAKNKWIVTPYVNFSKELKKRFHGSIILSSF